MSTSFESELMKLLDEHKDEIIQIRRYLHEYPNYLFMKSIHQNLLKIIIRAQIVKYVIAAMVMASQQILMPISQVKNQPGALTFMHCQSKKIMIYHLNQQNPGVMHASGSIRLIHQPAGQVANESTIKEMTLMMFAVFTL